MTIQEVVANWQKEKQAAVASRFPCRAVMVKNINEYCKLLSELKKISDIRFVQMSELFSTADIMPNYENLKKPQYQNEWLILTGVSEYLRLFAKNEITDRRFASLWTYQAPANSTGRIIIPLWGCDTQWFDKSLHLTDDLRQQDFFYNCSDPDTFDQELRLLVLSGKFDKYVSKLESMKGDLKIGLHEWFEYWLDPMPDKKDFVLLTKRASSVNTTNGNISIHVIDDTLTFITENMPGANILTEENCSEEMQDILLGYALKGIELDRAILDILNINTFSGNDIMGKWKAMPDSYKQFIRLWFEQHPDSTYLCRCFSVSMQVSEVTHTIMHEIFKVWSTKPEWVKEYRALMKIMALKPDVEYFRELDTIPVYETRLDFMSGIDREERIYLLRMVGKWMRSDYAQVMSCEKMRKIYPELYYYLGDNELNLDNELIEYISRYKSYKLENTLPEDEDLYFNGIQTDTYDMRYSILSESINSSTVILWIDALGIEWLPLLQWSIAQHCDTTFKGIAVGQSNLPTETEFNTQWKLMGIPYEKLDKLDKLAHKGVIDEPDYYSCIEDQISFVSSIHKTVTKLMEKYHRVIVTGDHGTSRLAARFFHKRDGVDVAQDIKVYSHGRYCDWKQYAQPHLSSVRVVKAPDGKQYSVFMNYDHFTKSGFAAGADDENAIYGEIHGGATPEEMLVPILVLDSNKETPLTGAWESANVKISRKKARFCVVFNKPVSQVMIRIGGIDGLTSATEDARRWFVEFPGIKPDTYAPQVFADNTILSLPDVTIKPALGGGEGDLL